MNDEFYIQQAITLAKKGIGKVEPNPKVGCVIVYQNKIVAQGYHEYFGGPHAEVNAINSLPEELSPANCTLYVTLEPCCHYGKTPPCVDLIISKGFKKVVVGVKDPNPLVSGKGIQKLKNVGIEVTTGFLGDELKLLNKEFICFHQKMRPYIILKWAQSADGFIAEINPITKKGIKTKITGAEVQKEVHQLRANCQAILVGKNTVLADNPDLNLRLVEGKNPIRIIIDKNLEVPSTFNVFNNLSATLVFNSKKNSSELKTEWMKIDFEKNVIEQILNTLYEKNIQSLLVEGGTTTLNHFIEQNLFDEVKVFKNENLFLKKGIEAPLFIGS